MTSGTMTASTNSFSLTVYWIKASVTSCGQPRSHSHLRRSGGMSGSGGRQGVECHVYSPVTRLVHLPVIENCAMFYNYGAEAKKGTAKAGRPEAVTETV